MNNYNATLCFLLKVRHFSFLISTCFIFFLFIPTLPPYHISLPIFSILIFSSIYRGSNPSSLSHLSFHYPTEGATRAKKILRDAPYRRRLTPEAPRRIRQQQQRHFRASRPQTRSLRPHATLESDGRNRNRGVKKGKKHLVKFSNPSVLSDAARATYGEFISLSVSCVWF